MQKNVFVRLVVSCLAAILLVAPTAVLGTVYTWTGAASDNDWANTANWDSNGIPVDNGTSAGLTIQMPAGSIVFNGMNAPSKNIPDIGGEYQSNQDSPTMSFKSGGSFSFKGVAKDSGFWTNQQISRDVLTIGDGVGGGNEDVKVTFTGFTLLNRHYAGITHNFVVNSDGTLIFNGGLKFSFNDTRYSTITLAGGNVVVLGAIDPIISSVANNYVNFNSPGSTFTASFGGAFTDLAKVTSRLGSDFKAYGSADATSLSAVDNGNNTFTVTMSFKWIGTAGDHDWSNILNWVDGVVPVDTFISATDPYSSGLTINSKATIEFDGENMPTINVPALGGATGHDTPGLRLNRGGAVVFGVLGRENGLWTNLSGHKRLIFEVGDGIGGGIEDVSLTLTNLTGYLSRHDNGTHYLKVNSDGTLIFANTITCSYPSSPRSTVMTINGGDIIVNGSVKAMKAYDDSYVDFITTNGSFTAKFGDDYSDLRAVGERIGADFRKIGNPNHHLRVRDNGNSTFTLRPVEYRWIGAAGDKDWLNPLNWANGTIPVDTLPGTGSEAGLNLPRNEFIVFDGPNLPAINFPGIGGFHPVPEKDSPAMIFKRGGVGSFNVVGSDKGFWSNFVGARTILSVGDGIGGGDEDVSITLTDLSWLNRHVGGSTHNFLVNSDGRLIVAGMMSFSYSAGADRWSTFEIAGGAVVATGAVNQLTAHANNKVVFTDVDGTFTAAFGNDFTDLASVKASLGVDFVVSSENESMRLVAFDNGNHSFTVKYALIPPAGTLIMVR